MVDFRTHVIHKQLPLVTIAMSSYNYSRYIKDALDSLLIQTYPYIELIIIDDCSADNSVKVIEEWISNHHINCTFIKHKTNLGIPKTLNELVQLSNGKYITMFASDDIMLPERVTRQVILLEEAGEEYGMTYARPVFMDDESNPFREDVKPTDFFNPEDDVLIPFIKREFGFITPTGLIRKCVYDKVGLYDERVLIEDYNFFLRLVTSYKVKYCDYPCIIYRWKIKGTPVFISWHKNNYERYFYDRILSNQQALRLIPDDKIKELLKQKITQYLKSMAVYNSAYFSKTVLYLLKNRYTRIPVKIVLIKLVKSFQSLFSGNDKKAEEILYD